MSLAIMISNLIKDLLPFQDHYASYEEWRDLDINLCVLERRPDCVMEADTRKMYYTIVSENCVYNKYFDSDAINSQSIHLKTASICTLVHAVAR